MRFLPALLVCSVMSRPSYAQVANLGADRMVGTAGLETLVPDGALGLPPNPAATGLGQHWSFGLATSSNSDIDVSEQSLSAAVRLRRVGLGIRFTTRRAQNLFDDPALADDAGLRVGNHNYAVSASYNLTGALSFGIMADLSFAEILSTTGKGIAYKGGMTLRQRWGTVGMTFGHVDAAMTWRSPVGTDRTSGTTRFALGVASPDIRVLGVEPMLLAEWNRDQGLQPMSWFRASMSVGLFRNSIRVLAGAAHATDQPLSTYREAGIVASTGLFDLQLGARFGAQPFPGTAMHVGMGVHRARQ